jgi:RNAse (barnase) inhibitor barstar
MAKMNFELRMLTRPEPPWVVTCQRGDSISSAAHELPGEDFVLVRIPGEDVKSLSAFYEYVSGVFGFPDYFGKNLNALIDCFEDQKMNGAAPLIMLFTDADLLLTEASVDALHGVLSAFGSIGERWSIDGSGVEWGVLPRGFLIILEYS